MQRMSLPAQRLELRARAVAAGRLGEALLAERQRLVGAEHQAGGQPHGDGARFFARQQCRDFARVAGRSAGLDAALVDVGRLRLDRNAGIRQHQAPHLALGSEHQRLRGKPERHRHPAGARRRSVRRLSTAAAVSSIERRVTSIDGQLCLAHSLRDSATSSATALRSMYRSSS